MEVLLMVHSNPLLKGKSSQKFITVGEIMLRLTPPNYGKIRVSTSFEASYGGSEANIALALANLGVDSTFFTVVPNNSLGKSAVRALRSNDVHCTPVILSAPEDTPTHRLGTYYLETGYGIRVSKVTYDRRHSAITEYDFSRVDLDALLDGFDWLHLSGITPALSPSCARLVLDCLKAGREKGMTISFDGNFRSALWSWEEARDFCTQCLPYVDVLLGIELDSRSDMAFSPVDFDYWIGSVHHLYDRETGAYHSVDYTPDALVQGCRALCGGDFLTMAERYFKDVAQMAARRPTILGHIDLITKFNGDGRFFDEDHPRCRSAALEALRRL